MNVNQSLEILINELSWPFPPSSAYAIARWLPFLPAVYGQDRTLDATVRCFVAHHIGNMTQDLQAVRYARSAYVEALNSLQKALFNPFESVSAEVLCAVLLLCMYEVGVLSRTCEH